MKKIFLIVFTVLFILSAASTAAALNEINAMKIIDAVTIAASGSSTSDAIYLARAGGITTTT